MQTHLGLWRSNPNLGLLIRNRAASGGVAGGAGRHQVIDVREWQLEGRGDEGRHRRDGMMKGRRGDSSCSGEGFWMNQTKPGGMVRYRGRMASSHVFSKKRKQTPSRLMEHDVVYSGTLTSFSSIPKSVSCCIFPKTTFCIEQILLSYFGSKVAYNKRTIICSVHFLLLYYKQKWHFTVYSVSFY
jgi:hypothetical protein